MNPKVDQFLKQVKKWREEMLKLRTILLQFPLSEELKWGKPCYTLDDSNLFIIQPFKEYCALMFCKGALLKDETRVLVAPGANTQGARQIRFNNLQEIVAKEAALKSYITEAIAAEKAGLKVTFKQISDFKLPEELLSEFKENASLKKAFNALTPGRQRAYLLFFSAPKQSKTRLVRIEKSKARILSGKGLND